MDTAEKLQGGGLFHQILPPRLEDAGLEDCALPPDSIREAFFKAATAVKSRSISLLASDDDEETDGHCIRDPWPTAADQPSDVLIGVLPERDPPGPCATEKGAKLPEFGPDGVVVGGGVIGGEERGDKVVAGVTEEEEGGGKAACVDGWLGSKIGGKKKSSGEEGEEREAEMGILGEGLA